ncbi:hypothetical protein BGZ93_004973 [Podila epicladia]|nr:hypothetical protein BGZ93_004973 [Podila epicladia]
MVDPAYNITFGEVRNILASYTDIGSIDAGYASTFVILGPMIHVLVADQTNLDKLKDALEAKALSYSEEDDGVHAGDQEALWSTQQMGHLRAVTNKQHFKFTVASSHPDSNKTAPSLTDKVTEILQSVILYLIPMLLLTPAQAREILIDLIENKAGAGTKKWPVVCKDFPWHSEFGSEVPEYTFPSLAALEEFHRCPMVLFKRQQSDHWRLSVEKRDSLLQAAVALSRPVASQFGGYLLAFVDVPSEEEIVHTVHLVAPNTPMHFYTPPTQYSQIGNSQRLFRIDGFMQVHVWDRQPANAVRVAKSSKAVNVEEGHVQGRDRDPHSNMPLLTANYQTCVIYIRCSHESQSDVSTSIERQFVTTLSKVQQLVDPCTIHRLEFAVDYVSSNTRSMDSRKMLPIILMNANNTLLLSSNPDRATRRPEEVEDIVNILQGKSSRWYTLGLSGHRSDWVQVSDDALETVQGQIRLTRQVATQQAFYTRVVYFEIRVPIQMRPKRSRQTGQLGVVRKHRLASKLCELAAMFDQVLVWSRVSPDHPQAGPSIRRQRMFCQAILGIDTVKRAAYKDAIQLSAFSNAAIETLIETIDPKMRTLIVCVSVDRLVRNATHLEALAEFLAKGSHQIVSLLQDPLIFTVDNASKFTKDCAAEGLLHSFQTGYGAYPALAPEVWFDHELCSWTKNVLTHAQSAEDFARALPITRFQGNPQTQIPDLVTQKIHGARGTTPSHAFATANSKLRRSKIIAGKRKAKDKTPPAQLNPSPRAAPPTSPPPKRSRLGSSTAASSSTSRGFCQNYAKCGDRSHKSSGTWCRPCYMKQYLENRLVKTCQRTGCTKETHKGQWCTNRCYGIAMGPNARKCKYSGCNNVSGPGFGTLCESHVTRTLKDEKRKTREEKAKGSGSQPARGKAKAKKDPAQRETDKNKDELEGLGRV